MVDRESPKPLQSLIASARRLTSKSMSRGGATTKGWQTDAWEMYDLVGELRFLAYTLAGRLSQARLYVGQVGGPTEAPDPVEDEAVNSVLAAIGASHNARSQMIQRLGVNLFISGDGWLAGIPKHLFPPSMLVGPDLEVLDPLLELTPPEDTSLSIEDLEWRMLSVSEVKMSGSGEVSLKLGETKDEEIVCKPDDIFLIRVWRPHPRRWWEADSPTRSSLPVLRELVGLTMHISAQVDSRLAGAGLLIVPQSAQRALQVAAGLDADDASDQFTEALMEAMITPISDRSNASAMVPLVVTVPDEATKAFEYITFAKPLDTESRPLRDEAIRRLALGLDAPPELLLGTGGMNHWGAWLVLEDVVTTHLEPPLALICDALTTQYLWPVLIDQGMSIDQAHQYVVWYDVSDLVVRPNRSNDAMTLHGKGVISSQALLDATGFDATDAPDVTTLPRETQMALELVSAHPALVASPGLPELVAQIRAVLANQIPTTLETPAAQTPEVGGEPVAAKPTATPPMPVPDGSIPATDQSPASLPASAKLPPGFYAPHCSDHMELQHRDGRKPWCNTCGWRWAHDGLNAMHHDDLPSALTVS